MQEQGLRGALLLEQAAYSFLAVRPAMTRKYSFHLVMAAHLFRRCNEVGAECVGMACYQLGASLLIVWLNICRSITAQARRSLPVLRYLRVR